MLLKNSINDLRKILHPDNILSSEAERYCYSQDSTNIKDSLNSPDIVVFAESTEEVSNLLKYANLHKIPVVARGAGTNMVGACVCNNGGIVLNFSRMNKILDFNPENMTMRVQPGVILNDIKKLAESKGLFYPPDPSNYRVSTIGGSIAQSSGGAMSFKYGTTKDYILSLTVVLADGTVMKLGSGTIKDAVGYHLNQLIIGSEGTLAIVVEAELKLIPQPECSVVLQAYFDTIENAANAVNNIISSGSFPSTLDFMDKNSINTVEDFVHCGLRCDKEALLLIELDGYASSLSKLQNTTEDILKTSGATDIKAATTATEKESIWTARRSSFAATAKLAPDVLTDDIIVPRSKISSLVCGVKSICDKYNLKVCIVGHAGDGNIHPQIALNLENDDEFKNYTIAKGEMYNLAISLGGTISAEHGIGIEKIPYLEKIIDKNVIDYMRGIKKLFDPNNILNPGKIFKL